LVGGLPGLAHRTRVPQWATNLDQASPKYFQRSAGTKVYGVKTALAIPMLSTSSTCVIIVYSLAHVIPDDNITSIFVTELSQYILKPKWKIVVDSDANTDVTEQSTSGNTMDQSSTYSDEDRSRHLIGNNSESALMKLEGISNRKDAPSPLTLAEDGLDEHEEDLQIANLLAQNIPLIASYPTSSSMGYAPTNHNNFVTTRDNNHQIMMENFISLRLLLLRTPDRRNNNENIIVGVIRQSYRGYRNVTRWNEQEIASLLIKDWIHLRHSMH
jgi:hypothetical protein